MNGAAGSPPGGPPPGDEFAGLSVGDLDRIGEHVAVFEAAWRRGERPGIADAAARAEASAAPAGLLERLLLELVHSELEFRLKAGEPARVEEYLAAFPRLASIPGAAAGLVAAEYRLRRRAEPGLGLSEYRRRFPALAALLAGGPAGEDAAAAPTAPAPLPPGGAPRPEPTGYPDLPGYEVRREAGRGGMGVVYEAFDLALGRTVAVKVVRSGSDPAEHERLRREAAAAAALSHPNVLPVFRTGEYAGGLFVVAEYAPGGTLADATRGEPVPPREAAGLLEPLARAVAYAHSKGVVHRDLKPQNVLLAEDGTPKVADFGLSRRLGEDGGLTRTGVVAGSPSYMAPEQAAALKEVGPAADVWALGAVLYELLTGRPPFKAAGALETLAQVAADDPVPPRRLVPTVPRDLETVCLKCLEKEPAKRYASAAALAEDLARFRRGEPVLAKPVGPAGRAARWARRNRTIAALLLLLAAAVAAGSGGSFWYAARADAHAGRAERNERTARESEWYAKRLLFAADAGAAEQAVRDGDPARAAALLALHEAERDGPYAFVYNHLDRLARCPGAVFDTHEGGAYALAVSPDGKTVAAGGTPGEVRLYDAASKKVLSRFAAGQGELRGFAFSPDGSRLAAAGGDGSVALWDWRARAAVWRKKPYETWAYGVAFAQAGATLVACGDSARVFLLDPATGETRATLDSRDEAVPAVAVSPDGRTLYVAGYRGRGSVWDLESRSETGSFDQHRSGVRRLSAVAGSPDGVTAAFGTITAELVLARYASRSVIRDSLPGGRTVIDSGGCRALAFGNGGWELIAGTDSGTVRICVLTPGGRAERTRARTVRTGGAAFRLLADGRIQKSAPEANAWETIDAFSETVEIAVAGDDLFQRHEDGLIAHYTGRPVGAAWESLGLDPSNREIFGSGRALYLRRDGGVFRLESDDWHRVLDGPAPGRLNEAGGRLHLLRDDGGVLRYAGTGTDWEELGTDEAAAVRRSAAAAGQAPSRIAWVAHADRLTAVVRTDGGEVLTASRDGGIAAWRPDEGKAWRTVEDTSEKFGTWLRGEGGRHRIVTVDWSVVRVIDPETGHVETADVPGVHWRWVAAAPDGRRLFAGATVPGLLKAWDVTPAGLKPAWEWRPEARCDVMPSAVPAAGGWVACLLEAAEGAAFPDGSARAVARFDAGTGRSLGRRPTPERTSRPATSADGSVLAVGVGKAVLLLDPVTLATRAELTGHLDAVGRPAFSPDGRLLASAADDGRVILWDVAAREAVRSWRADIGLTTALSFAPNGALLMTGSDERPPRVWDVETGRLLLEPGSAPSDARGGGWSPAGFSPDGRRIAAGYAGAVTILDGRPLGQ